MITAFHSLVLASKNFSNDRDAMARLLGVPATTNLGRNGEALFRLGNVSLMLTASDGLEGFVQTRFAIADADRWHRRMQRLGLAGTAAAADKGAVSDQRVQSRGLDLEFTDLEQVLETPPDASSISGVDHVVVSTSNPDACAALFGARLGLDMRLDLTRPDWNARLMFFRVGDAIMEVVQSADMPAAPDQDRFYGISWRTVDAEAAQSRLSANGFSVSEVRDGRKPGTRVFTVRDAPCGVPTLVIQPATRR